LLGQYGNTLSKESNRVSYTEKVGPPFLYAQPLLFGELAIMLWLIIKGAKQKPMVTTA